MSPRGEKKAGGRPPLITKGQKARQTLNCRVDADLYDWIKAQSERSGVSLGELTDLAFTIMQEHPERWPADKAEESEDE